MHAQVTILGQFTGSQCITRRHHTGAEFQPNRPINMESVNRNSHTARNEVWPSVSQFSRKSRLPVKIWYKTTPNFMKIRQAVRRWCLVTGRRTNKAVFTQCCICLLHKVPVNSESLLAVRCGSTLLTLHQLSDLNASVILQTPQQRMTERSQVRAQIPFMVLYGIPSSDRTYWNTSSSKTTL